MGVIKDVLKHMPSLVLNPEVTNPFRSKKAGWDAATLAILEGICSLLAENQSLPPAHPSHIANFYSPQGPRQKNKRERK